jgi:PilZ domain
MEPSQERRQFRRVPFRTRLTVSLRTSQALVKANVLDIGLGGVRLICAQPVSEGENALLTFRMRTRTGVQIEQVWSRVIHARMDDDAWVVGLKFNQVLDPQTTPLLAQVATSRHEFGGPDSSSSHSISP